MSKLDMIVVGGGLFGQIAAAHARSLGGSVVVVDDARKYSGSRAAGCIMRPSWMSKMSREQIDDSFSLLSDLYGLETVSFDLWPTKKTVDCYRVEPRDILSGDVRSEKCTAVTIDGCAVLESGEILEARAVVVAAGIWTSELCPWVSVTGRWGWSHRGNEVKRPSIRAWAPYRQIVSFNMRDGAAWIGDGSAFVEKSANDHNRDKSVKRCSAVTHLTSTTLGARPYCDTGGNPCHITKNKKAWTVTGGAKNGTAAAAWAALTIVGRILK